MAGAPGIYQLGKGLAQIDMLISFAEYSLKTNGGLPRGFKDDTNILVFATFGSSYDVCCGIHPMLLDQGKNVDPTTFSTSGETAFTLVTGENMSGKSTYCKKIALLQIMVTLGVLSPKHQP